MWKITKTEIQSMWIRIHGVESFLHYLDISSRWENGYGMLKWRGRLLKSEIPEVILNNKSVNLVIQINFKVFEIWKGTAPGLQTDSLTHADTHTQTHGVRVTVAVGLEKRVKIRRPIVSHNYRGVKKRAEATHWSFSLRRGFPGFPGPGRPEIPEQTL